MSLARSKALCWLVFPGVAACTHLPAPQRVKEAPKRAAEAPKPSANAQRHDTTLEKNPAHTERKDAATATAGNPRFPAPPRRLSTQEALAFSDTFDALARDQLREWVLHPRLVKWVLSDAELVEFPGAARVVVALRVESGCVVGVIDPETRAWQRLSGLGGWPCHEIDIGAREDLNGDHVPDFWFDVAAPSNRYDMDEEVDAVFLSDVSHASYCYAKRLTDFGAPLGKSSPATKQAARAASFDGQSVLHCNASPIVP